MKYLKIHSISLLVIHRFIALALGIIAGIVYLSTVAPTTSFWDCGEYIAAGFSLGVSHPPGAPLYILIARLFSLLPVAKDIALRINLISVLSSTLTVSLLYLIIVHFLREIKGTLQRTEDWLVAIFSGMLGSLTYAFTHSFWFNAVEAEVYAPAQFCITLMVWLMMIWSANAEKPGNEKYLLIIAYLLGLSIGIHFLTVLILPFLAIVLYFKKYQFRIQSFVYTIIFTIIILLAIYPGIVLKVPLLASEIGILSVVAAFILIIFATIYFYRRKNQLSTLVLMSFLLISLGYSSYTMIIIRSSLDPKIDMNNPESIEKITHYLNREQYGDHSIIDRYSTWQNSPDKNKYQSAWHFLWKYQLNKMYVRYFLWQFVGMAKDGVGWSLKQFWALPLILGLLGMWWQFKKSPPAAFSILVLFIMTGLAVVIYLNQPEPQPRERDYSYVGSFFAFSIWTGLGYAALHQILSPLFRTADKNFQVMFSTFLLIFLVLAVPAQLVVGNYQTHSRRGNYLARDFAYNMLMSCEPDAILFTNGDNDTYPLWYLQEVEGIRRDVRVICLQLLQTDWHIRQLRDVNPRVPMRISDKQLENLGFLSWQKQQVLLEIPDYFAVVAEKEYTEEFNQIPPERPREMAFRIKPSFQTPQGPLLGPMEQMILNIIYTNAWKRPIYFAVTMPHAKILGELARYLRLDGLTYKLVPYESWNFSPSRLRNNLLDHFQYRNLNNPSIYYNKDAVNLLQHYRHAFIQLASHYARNDVNIQNLNDTLRAMEEKLPECVIPYTNEVLKLYQRSLELVGGKALIEKYYYKNISNREMLLMGQILLIELKKTQLAIQFLESYYCPETRNDHLVQLLLRAYQKEGLYEKAADLIKNWMKFNQDDENSRKILRQFEEKLGFNVQN